MSNDGIFKGELATESQQLYGLFRRHFSTDELERLKAAYRYAVKNGGCEEPAERAPGVSYNPRPARICCLLIQEEKVTDPQLMISALLSSLHESVIARSTGEFEQEAVADALAVAKRSFPCPIRLEPLYLAHDLDILRHAHMSNQRDDRLSSVLSEISRRAACYSGTGRLHNLLSHALRRLAS